MVKKRQVSHEVGNQIFGLRKLTNAPNKLDLDTLVLQSLALKREVNLCRKRNKGQERREGQVRTLGRTKRQLKGHLSTAGVSR